jgi:hypothetical protein
MICFDGLLLISGILSARAARPTAVIIGVNRLARDCAMSEGYT